MNKKLSHTLKQWLPMAFIAVVMAALINVAVQQNFRSIANDPQIQLAEDVADVLSKGQPVESTVPDLKTDMAKSLAPFLMAFDDSAKPQASSAVLGDAAPVPPSGVFDFARAHNEDRFTWQPQKGVREAVVLRHYTGTQSGFILAGRSLRETEKRERDLNIFTAVGLAVALVGSFLLMFWKRDHHHVADQEVS